MDQAVKGKATSFKLQKYFDEEKKSAIQYTVNFEKAVTTNESSQEAKATMDDHLLS